MAKISNENIIILVGLLEGFVKDHGDAVNITTPTGDLIKFAKDVLNLRTNETKQLIEAIDKCNFSLT